MSLGHKEGKEYERVLFYYPQSPPEGMSPEEWDGLQVRTFGPLFPGRFSRDFPRPHVPFACSAFG